MRNALSDGEADVVRSAQAGDRDALDALIADNLPLVRMIAARALQGRGEPDEVVQETMLRVVLRLNQLRDPHQFRSWLVAITLRQVREQVREQVRRTRRRERVLSAGVGEPSLELRDAAELAALAVDAVAERELLVEALSWLDEEERRLVELWQSEVAGVVARPDLVRLLGLPAGHVAVRLHRVRTRVKEVCLILTADAARPPCPQLEDVKQGWSGEPSPLWRKRLWRHVRQCGQCRGSRTTSRPSSGVATGDLPQRDGAAARSGPSAARSNRA